MHLNVEKKKKKILTRGINLHYFETHDCTTFQTKILRVIETIFSVNFTVLLLA